MEYQVLGRPFKPGDVPEEDIRAMLILMENNPALDTRVSLVQEDGTDSQVLTFQEKHLAYLRGHPKVDPVPYLANLKTMIKLR